MRKLLLAASIAATLAGSGEAAAHDTWILAQAFDARSGEIVAVAMTSGMEFPKNDHVVSADRLERHTVRLGGSTATLVPKAGEEHHLALSAPLAKAGIAALAVSSKPREIELTPEQVPEYLKEIGAGPEVREAWMKLGGGSVRESYRKHATSFVRVGEPGDDRSWAEPQGLPLEIVPLADPTRATAGVFAVRVLFEGKPLAGLRLAAVCEEAKGETHARTGEDGRAELPLGGGRCLLKGVHLRRSDGSPPRWVSDFTTLTLSVQQPNP